MSRPALAERTNTLESNIPFSPNKNGKSATIGNTYASLPQSVIVPPSNHSDFSEEVEEIISGISDVKINCKEAVEACFGLLSEQEAHIEHVQNKVEESPEDGDSADEENEIECDDEIDSEDDEDGEYPDTEEDEDEAEEQSQIESEVEEEENGDVDFPKSHEEMHQCIKNVFDKLHEEHGVRIFNSKTITFRKELGAGAFGTVREGVCTIGGKTTIVAIKTLRVQAAKIADQLESFETEARVSWLASAQAREGKRSRICLVYGIAFDVEGDSKADLHLIMECVSGGTDLHNEIHEEKNWSQIREDSKDTGKRAKGRYLWKETDGDVRCYIMTKATKMHLLIEMGRIAVELERVGILHCDIKPANLLAYAHKGQDSVPRLKLIDFGEGNTPELAMGFIAGTPGYQPWEVAQDGLCSMWSEMYSIGVTLIEIWTGKMWDGAETRGEGFEGMKVEMLSALSKIQMIEPQVGRLIRRCVNEDPTKRPSPKRFLKEAFRIKRAMFGRKGHVNGAKQKNKKRTSENKKNQG